MGFATAFFVGRAQNRRRVDGGEQRWQTWHGEYFAALLRDAERAAEQGLSGRRSERYQQFGFDGLDLGIEPGTAGGDLACGRFLVDTALAARFPLEMLDGVGDVGFVAVDAGFFETAIEQESGGTDEGPAFNVFAIPRLFADKDEPRARPPFAEDGLRGMCVERASLTTPGGCRKAFQVVTGWEKIRCGTG